MGLNLLNKLRDELAEIAQVDQEPSLEGRQLLMVLSPLKRISRLKITNNMGYKLKTHSELQSVLKRQVHLLKVEVLIEIIYLQNNLQKEKDITGV